MKFLLFFLGITFYFIFYLFSKQEDIGGGIFQNLFFEAHLYIIISLLCIAGLYSPISGKYSDSQGDEKKSFLPSVSLQDTKKYVRIFFQNSLYYIAVVLFYASLFLIGKEVFGGIYIALYFLVSNIIVLFFVFFQPKNRVFQDFLRINTILVSLYYIFFHGAYLLGFQVVFQWEDFFNIAFLWTLFFLSLSLGKNQRSLTGLQSYILAFLFLEICVLSKWFFSDIWYSFGFFSACFSLMFLVGTQHIARIFTISLGLVRMWGIFFSCIFIGFFLTALFRELPFLYIFLPVVCIQSVLLFLFHERFQNYIALLGSILSAGLSAVFIFSFFTDSLLTIHFFIFCVIFSFALLGFYVSRKKYFLPDIYAYHSISLGVNLFGVIGLLFSGDFSILKLGIVLAIESLYFVVSSYIFRKKMKYVAHKNKT